MLATIASATLLGVDGHPVRVEVHVSNGLPGFNVVGLAAASCREARDRVRAALLSSDLTWPMQRVTVNLAPSAVRKIGAGLDLAIAVGLLVATAQLPAQAVEHLGFLGELGLDGAIRVVPGVVALVDALDATGVVVPPACAAEAGLVGRHHVLCAERLADLVAVLRDQAPWPDPPPSAAEPPATAEPDLAEVRGQPAARLALEVAAAGAHHLLLVGPPGAGKTMLASRLPGLLPDLTRREALEVTRVHSAAGLALASGGLVRRPPFRAPHHGASAVSLVGGGSAALRPGEISLAHRGVLFLDEVGEFSQPVLEALRQPLEEGVVRVSRAQAKATLPAHVLLVGATNPCPCGDGGPPGACRCSGPERQRYLRRLSGPLLDRFDLRVEVGRTPVADLLGDEPAETTRVVRARVDAARRIAAARGVRANAELPAAALDEHAPLTPDARRVLESALATARLSGRGLQRVRRVARTIADLHGAGALVGPDHVGLALALRCDPHVLEAAWV